MPRRIKQTVFGRRVRDAFFTQDPNDESLWVCFCKIERKQSGSGYNNVLSQVQSRHAAQLQDLRNAEDSDASSGTVNYATGPESELRESYFFRPKVISAHEWIEFVTAAILPFSVVENHSFQKQSKFQLIHRSSLMKYVSKLTRSVESKIRTFLPENFVLLFDGWTEGNTHFVALFASLLTSNPCGYRTFLLGFSAFPPLITDWNQTLTLCTARRLKQHLSKCSQWKRHLYLMKKESTSKYSVSHLQTHLWILERKM